MRLTTSRSLFGGALLAAGIASGASAQTFRTSVPGPGIHAPGADAVALWDQSGFDPYLNATVDQEFGDYGSYSTFAVDDFTTGGQSWNVSSVTTYFTDINGGWNANITTGKLQVFSKSGALPSNGGDIAPEYKVAVTLTDGGGYWIVNADTSGIAELQGINGDYWIGLTPTADFGKFGQEFHLNLDGFYGENAAIRNPGGSFGFGTDWASNTVIGGLETAYKLEGDVVPAPGAFALLGLGGLAAGRRRRA